MAYDHQEGLQDLERLHHAHHKDPENFDLIYHQVRAKLTKKEPSQAPSKKIQIMAYATALVLVLLIGIHLWERNQETQIPRIPVLTYHSVMPVSYYYPINVSNPWILQEAVFYQQMRYLYENNFNTVTSTQLIDFLFYEGELPPNPVIITFDDGYLDNKLFAAPILRGFGQTAMLFVVTDFMEDHPQTMAAYPLQFMSWCQVPDITDVFEIGSHAHAMHVVEDGISRLVSESMENVMADVLKSFTFPLTFTTGFAYPYGQHSHDAITALENAGVRFAFTTREAYFTPDTPAMLLPRFSVESGAYAMTMERFSQTVRGLR